MKATLLDDGPRVALTVRQPWAWAIVAGYKRLENRTWAPPDWLVGRDVLIHAGKRQDVEGVQIVTSLAGRRPDAPQCAGIVGIVRLRGVVTSSDDPWYTGPLAWVLDDVRALREPVPCRGYVKLWRPSEAVLRAVARQVA